MINFEIDKRCTGCAACADICPKSCITFRRNKIGFLQPIINKEKCINCHLCEKVCPHLNKINPENFTHHAFCAYNFNEDERKIGSSGSIMVLLAKRILSRGGVVYGASYTEGLKVKHTRAVNYKMLLQQSKSKYIQSDTRDVYKKVKLDLEKGIQVMFVGTPCQVTALYNFIPYKLKDNLLLIDFVCHGVQSQDFFDCAIKSFERKNKCKVETFSFREKSEKRLRNYKIVYSKDSQQVEEIGVESKFPYYNAYMKHLGFRNSCFNCKFATQSRISDVTIGDMWGLETTLKPEEFAKGYSLIYANTIRGYKKLMDIQKDCELKEYNLDDPILFNYSYKLPTKENLWNYLFRFFYSNFPYRVTEKLLLKSEEDMHKIHKLFTVLCGKMNKIYVVLRYKSKVL